MDEPADLTGVTVAFLATDGVEQVELTHPWAAVGGAQATVHLVAPQGEVRGFHRLDPADTFVADRKVDDANPATYDALVLPGGVANPDQLRTDPQALAFVGAFLSADKVVAAICHAPWTLIEVDAVGGRDLTSWPSLRTDLEHAGARWHDEPVVIDRDGGLGTLITSRGPDDLTDFADALIGELVARRAG